MNSAGFGRIAVCQTKRTQGVENIWEEGLMSKFHWTVALTVAACLMSAPAHADRFNEVVVVTHVDVDPQMSV